MEIKCVRPGDRILLEEGKVFRGPLRLTVCVDHSKAAGTIEVRSFSPRSPADVSAVKSPATIEAAVTARAAGLQWERPGADQLPTLIPSPGRDLAIYKLGPIKQDVAELFHGGRRLLLARTPSDPGAASGSRFAKTEKIKSDQDGCAARVCIQASEIAPPSRGYVAGLYAVIRNSPWSFARSEVSGIEVATGEIRLSETISGSGSAASVFPQAGYGVVLLNSPAFLDTRGEWYFDKATRSLYVVWDAAAPPSDQQTEIVYAAPADSERFKHEGAALSFWGNPTGSGDSYKVDISRLAIRHSAGYGVRIVHAPHIRLADMLVEKPREGGITVHGAHASVEITSSSVTDAPANGIRVSSAKIVRIEANKISGAGYLANQDRFDMDFNGIRAGGFQSASISRNRVATVGYAGVMLAEPPSIRDNSTNQSLIEVVDNVVSDFCRLLNDCGAIYINGSQSGDSKSPQRAAMTKRVAGNTISIPGGNLDGTPGPAAASAGPSTRSGASIRMVGAVYLDHGASHFDVHGNKVAGTYEPYGWRIFNKGILNACSRQEATACVQTKTAYQCYTDGLDKCNSVERTK